MGRIVRFSGCGFDGVEAEVVDEFGDWVLVRVFGEWLYAALRSEIS
jgi:hypothetical protein